MFENDLDFTTRLVYILGLIGLFVFILFTEIRKKEKENLYKQIAMLVGGITGIGIVTSLGNESSKYFWTINSHRIYIYISSDHIS